MINLYPTTTDIENDSHGIETYSLADTGCTDSIINFDFFRRILNKHDNYIIGPSKFVLNLAEQDKTMEVIGETEAWIKITDGRGNSVAFVHNFLLIKNLNHKIFLGTDLLASEWVYAKTRHEIIFNKVPGET